MSQVIIEKTLIDQAVRQLKSYSYVIAGHKVPVETSTQRLFELGQINVLVKMLELSLLNRAKDEPERVQAKIEGA